MSLNKDEKPMSIQEVANQLHAEWDNRQYIEAIKKEFDEEIGRIEKSHSEDLRIQQEAHDRELLAIKKDIAYIKPIADMQYQKEAAVAFGKRLGNNITWLGGVLGAVFAALVALYYGFKFAVAEAVKHIDKLPPPGVGQ